MNFGWGLEALSDGKEVVMRVEITGVGLKEGIVVISCCDISEEHLLYIERMRDDGQPREFDLVIDSRDSKSFNSLRKWMKKQSCTQGKTTWGDALHSLIGTITDTYGVGRFRVRD